MVSVPQQEDGNHNSSLPYKVPVKMNLFYTAVQMLHMVGRNMHCVGGWDVATVPRPSPFHLHSCDVCISHLGNALISACI